MTSIYIYNQWLRQNDFEVIHLDDSTLKTVQAQNGLGYKQPVANSQTNRLKI